MKKLLIVSPDRLRLARAAGALLLALGLTTGFWIATLPVAVGRLMTPTEMIEAGLPPGVVIKTAGKPQFLTAVCAAVRKHRKDSPAIARTAVTAHGEYAGDIVATVVRCLGGKQDCELVGTIVGQATSAAPDSAVAIDDAALAIAPDCADAIQSASVEAPAEGPGNYGGPPPISQAPLPGAVGGGGGFNPGDAQVLVCDMGRQHAVRTGRIQHFLNHHPGAYIGVCQITTVVNR